LDVSLWKSGEADRGLSLQAAEVADLAEVRGHQITDQPQHLLHQKIGIRDISLSLQAAEVADLAEVRGHQITDQPQHLLHQ
jgi:hypothetical protein